MYPLPGPDGGGDTILLMGGLLPHLRSGGGYPIPGPNGGIPHPADRGVPYPRSKWEGGYPIPGPNGGIPHPADRGLPHPRSGGGYPIPGPNGGGHNLSKFHYFPTDFDAYSRLLFNNFEVSSRWEASCLEHASATKQKGWHT